MAIAARILRVAGGTYEAMSKPHLHLVGVHRLNGGAASLGGTDDRRTARVDCTASSHGHARACGAAARRT